MNAKINKAQVLRKAWNDFRSMGGNTMAIFAMCLRNAWSYYKEAAAMGKQGAQFYINNVKEQILEVNFSKIRVNAVDGWSYVRSVRDAACGFASYVAATVAKYGKCSEKQAYVIARACYDLGI